MNVIEIIGIHLVGGKEHEHISELKWIIPGIPNSVGVNSREKMVEWLRDKSWITPPRAFVTDGIHTVDVHVVNASPPYVQTYRDGIPTDNLLKLPQNW